MDERIFKHDHIESLGQKLDRFAEELPDDERNLLATLIEAAGQTGVAKSDLSMSDRLHRVRIRADVGAVHVII